MRSPLTELNNANEAIERSIDSLDMIGRGAVSQDVVSKLRHLVEAVAMLTVNGPAPFPGDYYRAVNPALKKLKNGRGTRFIPDFHDLLQKVVSHYVPDEDSSERLLLKYVEFLTLLKKHASDELNVSILANMDKIPVDEDPGLAEYHAAIAVAVDDFMLAYLPECGKERYYVRSAKPFYVNDGVYYETTLIPAFDLSSKFDHVLVFSSFRIPTSCAVRVDAKQTSIYGLGSRLPVTIVVGYETSVRPCELNAILKILGRRDLAKISGKYRSYKSLMAYMSANGATLLEVVQLPDDDYGAACNFIEKTGAECAVHALLDASRKALRVGASGSNVLKYLLAKPRNRVLKAQLGRAPNSKLGGLWLQNGCIPFDEQPYCTSLLQHEVAVEDLFSCIDPAAYKDNLLARRVSKIAADTGTLYVPDSEFGAFSDVDGLIESYNRSLFWGHSARRIAHEMGHLFMEGDEADACLILRSLLDLSGSGLGGYAAMADAWLDGNPAAVDDPAKKEALRVMFDETKVAFVYGSAGTGKTTMVNILCDCMDDVSKIAIATTNPAVDNLKRKIRDRDCECMTIAKYLNHGDRCGLLIIDECSTVSNRDMKEIVGRGTYDVLLLVGDERQIESINLGNWFSLARKFLPGKCVHEFLTPWRAANKDLSTLWTEVREMREGVAEVLAACGMTSRLDETVLVHACDDEIVLCLNYDGLYGINNMNKLLQTGNANRAVNWNLHTYKVGDPVLFNESNRFHPLLYNNLKGRIEAIDDSEPDSITFTVAVEKPMTVLSVRSYQGLKFVGSFGGKTSLSFTVLAASDEDDGELRDECVVPFQVAYAVSIHKAQGLEYSSVKLIVTKDVESRITHNIFYTAITRARERLCIYWSPEIQKKVLSSFSLANCNRDALLLSNRCGLALNP